MEDITQKSVYTLARKLEGFLISNLSMLDLAAFDRSVNLAINLLKKDAIEMRLQIRDYQLSQTREEQIQCLGNCKAKLNDVKEGILTISQYGIFSPVDVAYLTANADLIIDSLV